MTKSKNKKRLTWKHKMASEGKVPHKLSAVCLQKQLEHSQLKLDRVHELAKRTVYSIDTLSMDKAAGHVMRAVLGSLREHAVRVMRESERAREPVVANPPAVEDDIPF